MFRDNGGGDWELVQRIEHDGIGASVDLEGDTLVLGDINALDANGVPARKWV